MWRTLTGSVYILSFLWRAKRRSGGTSRGLLKIPRYATAGPFGGYASSWLAVLRAAVGGASRFLPGVKFLKRHFRWDWNLPKFARIGTYKKKLNKLKLQSRLATLRVGWGAGLQLYGSHYTSFTNYRLEPQCPLAGGAARITGCFGSRVLSFRVSKRGRGTDFVTRFRGRARR
jgi:hypothetical protein